MRYETVPQTVEAMRYDGTNIQEVLTFVGRFDSYMVYSHRTLRIKLPMVGLFRQQELIVNPDDFIVEGTDEFTVVPSTVFPYRYRPIK
jgi:hypothetical protein